MKDQYKTKKQLIEELEVLRNQLVKPKKTEANHKRAEETLRESEEKYRNLVERANDGIAIGQDGIIRYVNPRLAHMAGYTIEEVTGAPIFDFFFPEERAKLIDRYRRRLAGEDVPTIYESALKHKDGSRIEVEINAGVISYDGKPADLVLFRDITERKKAEEALRESQERFKIAAQSTGDLIWDWNIPTGRLQWFGAIDELLGYAPGRFPRTIEAWEKVIHPDDHDRVMSALDQHLKGRTPYNEEYRVQRKDGTYRYWMDRGTVLRDSEGNPLKMVGACIDITERKQTEDTLRESEERYRRIVDNSLMGIGIARGNKVLFANPALLRLYGYDDLEEFTKIPLLSRVAPASQGFIAARMEKVAQGEPVPAEFEYDILCKDGRIKTLLASGQQFKLGGAIYSQMIFQDITERKRAEEALRESEERFRKLVETMKVGLASIDENGVLTYVNEYFSTMLGYTIDEMIGRSTLDFYYDEEGRKAQEKIFAERRAGMRDSSPYEVIWRKKDGQKVYSILSPTPIFDADGRYTGSFAIHTDITDRKQVEMALRESEERFRKLVETMKVGLATVDENGVLTYVNEYSSSMIGYTIDEMIGHSPTDFYYDEEQIKGQEEIFERRRKGMRSAPTHEVAWRTKDGRKVYSILSPTPIFDSEGRYRGSFAIHTEITERKQVEEALRESEERFRLAFENANTGVCLVDLEGNLTKVNNKMCEIFGYTKEELEHLTVNDIAHPEDINKSPAFIQRTLRGETDRGTFEKRYIHKKGHVVTCQVSSSLVRNADGSPLYFISHVQDITERKQAEELLQKERETSLSILENAPYGVALIGKGGQYIYINPEFTNITGYTLQEIPTGKDWYQKVFPDQKEREKMIQFWKEDRAKGKMMNREFGIHCKDGKIREIETRVTFLKNGHALIVLRDITEQKLSEERMESLREQLRQSQKMEAIGRLAGGVAHDFNNLLTIIKGYSQLSLIELKEDGPLKKNIEHIHGATDRAANLVRQLLAFSRRHIMEMKVLDLNAVLTNLDNMLRRVIGEDIELTTILAEDLGRVKTDQGWIEQAIMNLVVNSRDAMPSGGKLTIETGNVDLDEASTYGHFGVEPGRYVMLSVSDTGVGITPEVMERLFEPFFSTKEKDKGTGLGLSMAYGIVKQSGGDIWVHGAPGEGATFRIYLPRVDEPLEERREKVLGDELFRGTETILLVEDEENVRKLTLCILERHGYKVLSARDGDDALLICEQFKDPIHLMLTDVVMPRMSGHDLAKHLKSSRPKMKVLYMSGYTDNTIVLHGVLMEGVDFIQKPFTVDALTKKIREVLKQ